jgi:hypothetical protein
MKVTPKIDPSAGPPAQCAKRAIHYMVRTLHRAKLYGVSFSPVPGGASISNTYGRSSDRVRGEVHVLATHIVTFVEKILPSGLASPNSDRLILYSLACWRTRHLAVEQT